LGAFPPGVRRPCKSWSVANTKKYKAALTRYDSRKIPGGSDRRFPLEPGPVHAVEGNALWNPGMEFRDRPIDAQCHRPVLLILGVEFDPGDSDACPDCVRTVAAGGAPSPYLPRECGDVVHPRFPGYSQVMGCKLRAGHRGRHRGEGASWEDYGLDFAPSDFTTGLDE